MRWSKPSTVRKGSSGIRRRPRTWSLPTWQMPVMDGLQLLRVLQCVVPPPAVIAISGDQYTLTEARTLTPIRLQAVTAQADTGSRAGARGGTAPSTLSVHLGRATPGSCAPLAVPACVRTASVPQSAQAFQCCRELIMEERSKTGSEGGAAVRCVPTTPQGYANHSGLSPGRQAAERLLKENVCLERRRSKEPIDIATEQFCSL